jgi:Na+/proline symporter
MEVKPRTLDKGSLWLLTVAPTIWAAHLLLCYITAAIWCARFADRDDPLAGIRTAIAWYTAVALIGIAMIGWEGFRRHSYGTETSTHDLDSPEDRHRFLGFATLLLSGLSAVAVLYAALAAVYFDTCR